MLWNFLDNWFCLSVDICSIGQWPSVEKINFFRSTTQQQQRLANSCSYTDTYLYLNTILRKLEHTSTHLTQQILCASKNSYSTENLLESQLFIDNL